MCIQYIERSATNACTNNCGKWVCGWSSKAIKCFNAFRKKDMQNLTHPDNKKKLELNRQVQHEDKQFEHDKKYHK